MYQISLSDRHIRTGRSVTISVTAANGDCQTYTSNISVSGPASDSGSTTNDGGWSCTPSAAGSYEVNASVSPSEGYKFDCGKAYFAVSDDY